MRENGIISVLHFIYTRLIYVFITKNPSLIDKYIFRLWINDLNVLFSPIFYINYYDRIKYNVNNTIIKMYTDNGIFLKALLYTRLNYFISRICFGKMLFVSFEKNYTIMITVVVVVVVVALVAVVVVVVVVLMIILCRG
jgi:hypothetical protein